MKEVNNKKTILGDSTNMKCLELEKKKKQLIETESRLAVAESSGDRRGGRQK